MIGLKGEEVGRCLACPELAFLFRNQGLLMVPSLPSIYCVVDATSQTFEDEKYFDVVVMRAHDTPSLISVSLTIINYRMCFDVQSLFQS